MTTTSSRRELLFVSLELRGVFRREWDAIDRRFPHFSEAPDGVSLDEHWGNLQMLRDAARDELRQAVREAVKHGLGGDYPISV